MKKTLIAVAALAVAGAASAQVTLGGKIGVGLEAYTGQAARLANTDAGISIAVSEDLGGGLKLSFSQAFQKTFGDSNSTTDANGIINDGGKLSLSGGFGTVTWNETSADADQLGVGSVPTYSTNTAMNATTDRWTYVQYDAPKLGALSVGIRVYGATGALELASSNNPQLRLGYAGGPLSLFLNARSAASEMGGSYDMGVAKFSMVTDLVVATTAKKKTEMALSVPMGAVTAAVSYATSDTKSGTELDVQYALTKRTSIRASAFTGNKSSTVMTKVTSNRIKLFHTF